MSTYQVDVQNNPSDRILTRATVDTSAPADREQCAPSRAVARRLSPVVAAGLAAFPGSYLETSAAPALEEQMSEESVSAPDRREWGLTEAELLCGYAEAVTS